jgi:tetratricopeptide (TPR) repeat protein
VLCLDWSSTGTQIASGSSDDTIRLWDSISYGEQHPQLKAFSDAKKMLDPIILAKFESGEDQPSIRNWIHQNASLTPIQKRASESLLVDCFGKYGASVQQLNMEAWTSVDPDREDRETDVELALKLIRVCLQMQPDCYAAQDTLAWALYENGLYDEAIEVVQKLLGVLPDEGKDTIQESLGRLNQLIEKKLSDAPTTSEKQPGDTQ